jgi:hypothetical protein
LRLFLQPTGISNTYTAANDEKSDKRAAIVLRATDARGIVADADHRCARCDQP